MTRLIPFVLGALAGFAARAHAAPSPEDAVRATVTRVLHRIDAKRFADLRPLLADSVHTDYTSLFGGAPVDQDAEALIAGWKAALSPVQATQHLLGPIDVVVTGNEATAECHVRGEHVTPGLPGGDEWMVAGHYLWKLRRKGSSWVVTSLTLETYYQTGNRKLLEEAAAKK
jgi:hypothetical protein